MKAVLITAENQRYLAGRFNVEYLDQADLDDQLPIGQWLVTAFGVDEHFETLTQEKFDETYPGEHNLLENGFVEVG